MKGTRTAVDAIQDALVDARSFVWFTGLHNKVFLGFKDRIHEGLAVAGVWGLVQSGGVLGALSGAGAVSHVIESLKTKLERLQNSFDHQAALKILHLLKEALVAVHSDPEKALRLLEKARTLARGINHAEGRRRLLEKIDRAIEALKDLAEYLQRLREERNPEPVTRRRLLVFSYHLRALQAQR